MILQTKSEVMAKRGCIIIILIDNISVFPMCQALS